MDNLEISFGGKTREGDSVTVIKNAPGSAYEFVRTEVERLQRLMEGLTVACAPTQYDQVDITLTLKKGSPEKHTEIAWIIIDAIIKRTERILAELRASKPEPPEPPDPPVTEQESSKEGLLALLPTEPLVCVNVPRILHGEDTEGEKLKKKKFQMVILEILGKFKKYLAGEKIHTKVTQRPGDEKGTMKVYMGFDKEQIPRAIEFLKKFQTECGGNIHAEQCFVFEPIAGEENRFELKLTPPNSTSS